MVNRANNKIFNAIRGIDKSQQLQSVIHGDLLFRRNSINLFIGRRGSGKTFNVMRELIKLSGLPNCGGYNSFIYVTDKTNDNTVNELIKLIKLKTKVVKYEDAPNFLADLIDAKNAYEDVLKKGLQSGVSKNCKKDLFETLDLNGFTPATPSTVVLYDDAINIFKTQKYRPLLDLLFQNRQAK